MSKHPNNGPSFSKPTYRAIGQDRTSPERERAQREQTARECASTREFNKLLHRDRIGALESLGLLKKK
jgi:hypothetical protein